MQGDPPEESLRWNDFWRKTHKKLIARLTGAQYVWEVGSGYSVEGERMRSVKLLKELCDEAVSNKAFLPGNGKTHCNRSVRFIAQGFGYGFSPNDLASDQLAAIALDPAWEAVPLRKVSQLAQQGVLVILGIRAEPHGHVVVAYPDKPQVSGKWGGEVPMVANVGQKNWVCKLSEAFFVGQRDILECYAYIPTTA